LLKPTGFRFHHFGAGVLNAFSQIGHFLLAEAHARICDSKAEWSRLSGRQ
jgi:hypothetical protein